MRRRLELLARGAQSLAGEDAGILSDTHSLEDVSVFDSSLMYSRSGITPNRDVVVIAECGIQTEALPQVCMETTTDIVWERDGFSCRRCSGLGAAVELAKNSTKMQANSASEESEFSVRRHGLPPQIPTIRREPQSPRASSHDDSARHRRVPRTDDGASSSSERSKVPSDKSLTSARRHRHERQGAPSSGSSPALLSEFRVTVVKSCQSSLLRLIKHWNVPHVAQRTCCPLHRQLELTKELLRLVAKVPCDPLWSPWTGWQCPSCTCMNCPTTRVCELCQWVQQLDISVDVEVFDTGLPVASCTPQFEAMFGGCRSRLFFDLVEDRQSFLSWFQTAVNNIEHGVPCQDSHTLLLRHSAIGHANARRVVAARCRLECQVSSMNPNDILDIDDAVMTLRLLDVSEPMMIFTGVQQI